MSHFLRRISVNLDRHGSVKASGNQDVDVQKDTGNIPSVHSFNDFSMHVGQEMDRSNRPDNSVAEQQSPSDDPFANAREARRSFDVRPPPFVVGSAPSGLSPIATRSLSLPKSSVAQILWRETPRSSLDAPSNSFQPTPRSSLGQEEPASPRSPTTPGSRRKRQQKIHGLDYYEFCELVRAGSL